MRVLDLDLDFFLNDVPYYRSARDGRLDNNTIRAWPADSVDSFLRDRCCLDVDFPICGRFVTDHHEVFHVWRELIETESLTVPFEVVHIDSHADLGVGDTGYVYLMTDILHRQICERHHPEIGSNRMDCGNYLAFALACRWINKVTYVPNPNGRSDLFEYYFQNGNSQTGVIQFKAVSTHCSKNPLWLEDTIAMESTEPDISFQIVAMNDFVDNGTFDFFSICKSPSFTPPESDNLIPVIRRYLREV